MIDVNAAMEDHGPILATAIGRGLKPFDIRIDP
jgi:hypothetical protein